jgi:hypothetical protein
LLGFIFETDRWVSLTALLAFDEADLLGVDIVARTDDASARRLERKRTKLLLYTRPSHCIDTSPFG